MSILIRGMEMPKNCAGCPFFVRSDSPKRPFVDCKLIGQLGSVFNAGCGIPVDCPLIHVPPHGDLIERKVAYDSLLNGMVMAGYQSRALDCINEFYVPTIIPAEEE